MKRLFSAMSPRWQRLLVGRGIGWIIGLFPHPDESWKECSWCF